MNEDDALSIREAKKALSSNTLEADLAYIKCNFNNIPVTITALEARNLSLIESIKIFQRFQENIKKAPGPIVFNLTKKMDKIMKRNPGWTVMERIARNLEGYSQTEKQNLTPSEMANLKFSPLTSCEVERTFSIYKTILSDNRASFTSENLEKYIVINCNAKYLNK